jgi:Predicted Zn-dependent hydrolases of the beta-lactamase fold
MELTWHGHSTWHVVVGDTTLLLDPFFQNPLTAVAPADVTTDYLLLTHGHTDHIADVGAFDEATVATTPELAAYVTDEFSIPEGQTIGFNMGGTVELGDAYVTMVRADHTNGLNTDYAHSGGPPTGYVLSDTHPTDLEINTDTHGDADATTFYHAGDTALMSELKDVIGPYLQPDAAALPAGDHFTMGPRQAAVAAGWLEADVVFPMHYDTFPPIEIDTNRFETEVTNHTDAQPVVLEADETYTI